MHSPRAAHTGDSGFHRLPLSDAPWELQLLAGPAPREVVGRSIPATIPGCVHTDLMAAGLIEDPYLGTNELATKWIGECDWLYTCRFEADVALLSRQRIELVFNGLDTLATLRLNGQPLGSADNMHATWRFDAKTLLREGSNTLEIQFAAPVPYVKAQIEQHEREIGPFPGGGSGSNPQLPHHMIRKMHCNFGWDWGPALITSGIWRPASLEAWNGARIVAVRPEIASADERRAEVRVAVDLDGDGSATFRCADPDGKVVAEGPVENGRASFIVDNPHLWWPAGYGDQPLYELTATTDTSQIVRRKLGLRKFQWHSNMDPSSQTVAGKQQPAGNTFHPTCNGVRIFCKGANWIPDDCFPHRVTPQRYRRRVEQAREANMNMLRVWGGGLYEDDAFYDACDELGILVWQDFTTACAAYPETEAFQQRFEREARDNIARLAGRASLALWCGGNENITATYNWGPDFRALRQAGYGWGRHYWYELFPRILRELDPGTFYWPNSPWSGTDDINADDEHVGDQHIWDVWNGQGDWRNYWSHVPRFASEFGFHGPPTWPTLAEAIAEKQRHWFSEAMVLHNKQEAGQERAINRAADHFRLPEDSKSPQGFDDIWFIAAVNQARALEAGCGWFRALSPWCGGALFWQHNDCWPVASWSCLDQNTRGEARPKLLWYAARRFFAPRMLQILPEQVVPKGTEPGRPRVVLRNDGREPWQGTLRLRLVGFDGRAIEHLEQPFALDPGAGMDIAVPQRWPARPETLLLAETGGAARATWFYARDMDLPYPPQQVRVEVEPGRAGQQLVRLTADALVRDLCLLADRLEPTAQVSNQLLTLLPGESVSLTLHAARSMTTAELSDPRVLRSVNPFGAQ